MSLPHSLSLSHTHTHTATYTCAQIDSANKLQVYNVNNYALCL